MRVTGFLAALMVVRTLSVQAKKHTKLYSFEPDEALDIWNDGLPTLYTFNETHLANLGGSWWTSSFITGTEREQSLVISHILDISVCAYFRASILGINTPGYKQFLVRGSSMMHNSMRLDLQVGNNPIQSVSEDDISQMRAYSINPNFTFDLIFNATFPILPNAGAGAFIFGAGTSSEWALPRCKTEGTLTGSDGKKVTIDPDNSFTWYDRQYGTGTPPTGNWTWFEFHVPGLESKLSIWAIDNPDTNQTSRLANIHGADDNSQDLLAEFYPKDQRFGSLDISSVLADQEIVGTSALETAYEGFVAVISKIHAKHVQGYGLVAIVYGSWD
ncbi:kievitone hydratase [Aspergillus homomorphus CBS 101889]|uniref:Kievitone hydratase n=1 Tax=Aspergillus homomorphus (strain CBS 101889) TaxID=1450537 RepID=A0A395HUR7_ASPHC|nr:kievitone hydratase [Aspergillus homomorphus CBS 101889]RAL09964.1 kievitone hydratase [Aspergillus homomorphus CBS 101889]